MRTGWMVITTLGLMACGGEESAPAPETASSDTVAPTEEATPEPPPAPDPNEACARVIVVAWQGAMAAPATVTRSEEEARTRAEELRAQLEGGTDFAELARAQSDAASSGPRGGMLGTYRREDFPSIHEPIRDPIFALEVDALSEVIRAPYGYVVARRCAVEKIHTRHILVRYQGARNAGDDITRSEAEARTRAEALRGQVTADGADFAAIAREESDDGSAENGGDVGMVGRGILAPAYEEAAWQLSENQISDVVQTEFGFHVIQRLPDVTE